MKLRNLIEKLLLSDQKYRDSDRELVWAVWEITGFIKDGVINKEDFISAPNYTTIDRRRRNDQRSDSLTGSNKIQASPNIRKRRKQLADQKGFKQISAKEDYYFDRGKMAYVPKDN